MGVGNASGVGGGKNVEGERSKGKGCAWKRARSERGASPWPLRHWRRSRLGSRRFTRKERTRILQLTQRRGVHARAADVRLLFRSTFEHIGREKKKEKNFCIKLCASVREKFRSAFSCFFFLVDFSGDSRCHTVIRSPVPIEDSRSDFRITRTRAYKGRRCVFAACVADDYRDDDDDCKRLSARVFVLRRSIVLQVKPTRSSARAYACGIQNCEIGERATGTSFACESR